MVVAEGKIRVMLVDDSAVVRGMIQKALQAEPSIAVVATAIDGQMAIDMLKRNPADVIILDIEMPGMDGMTALPILLEVSPHTKIIMASTLTLRNAEISIRALQLGATDYLAKPSATERDSLAEFYRQLIEKIKALGGAALAQTSPVTKLTPAAAPVASASAIASNGLSAATSLSEALRMVPHAQAIAIASSTGGPQALLNVFTALKGKMGQVPIFITQHMPANFTKILAEHIRNAAGVDCHEGQHGEAVKPGVIYVAPGDYHMRVEGKGSSAVIKLDQNPPENFCRPSADPMLRSLAQVYGGKLFTVVLTGMGADGMKGAMDVVQVGGTVLAQNEATCVVYGMPKAVVDAKLAKMILPLNDIAPCIARAMGG